METNRANEIGLDQRIDAGLRAGPSALQAASDARIEAARLSLTGAGAAQVIRVQQESASPQNVAGNPVGPSATAVTGAPPPPTTRELAALAADVYTPGAAPPAGWDLASAAQLAEIGLTESMLTSPTTDFAAEVYARQVNGQTSYVVAFRGTQSGADWRGNFQQGLGLRTDYYNRALEIGERLVVPNGARVTLTGHSLGGGLASAAATASELDATTFNAAGLSRTTLADARAIARADGMLEVPDISAYYVRGDLLSTLQDGGDRMIGALLGGVLGASVVDMPEAVGTRIELDPVRPEGMRWYQDHPVARHLMDYVQSSLPAE